MELTFALGNINTIDISSKDSLENIVQECVRILYLGFSKR